MWLNYERMPITGKSGDVPRRPSAPNRIILHTTETPRLPNYSWPPHFTIGVGHPQSLPNLPRGRAMKVQHVAMDRAAYALLHPAGTPETNHMGRHCVQIEIITYARYAESWPDELFEVVADTIRDIISVVPVPLVYPNQWRQSGSYGPSAPQRMSDSEWATFNGICGHQHVPHNSHWDPGAIDIRRLVETVARGPVTPPTTTPDPEQGDDVTTAELIQRALTDAGYDPGPVDGVPGPRTLAALTAALQAGDASPLKTYTLTAARLLIEEKQDD